tara:strand:+ start:1353 stop:1835 length:483 start_codon:yes stop_codon:yes gene_type:complete
MTNKTIIYLAIAILIGGGLIWLTSQSSETPSPTAATGTTASLKAEVSQYDFGTIDINGGDVTTEFPVTNTGEEPIIVVDGTTSCACTSAEIEGVGFDMHKGMNSKVTIEPGETKTLTATYDPLFHGPNGTGKITREVILKTNSVVTPEVRVRFAANVVKN